jgi:hypothetical protein
MEATFPVRYRVAEAPFPGFSLARSNADGLENRIGEPGTLLAREVSAVYVLALYATLGVVVGVVAAGFRS